ncbi:MAG: hypothetical protein GC156_03850 [Actinomycetales bacterium]|nr:hypothetical protein [Actinomycetales bacterium]
MKKALALASASSLALAGIVLGAPAAQAKNDQIRMSGACDAPSTSTWTVKVKNKKAQLRTDFWVKTDGVGQTWDFRLVRDDGGTQTLLTEDTKATVASDDSSSDSSSTSTSVARIAFRDRGEDDGPDHDSTDDRVTGMDDSSGMDDSADDGPNHDAFDDDSNGMEDSHDSSHDDSNDDSSSSSSSSSSNHVGEVKFRTWIANTGGGDLVFTATYNGETCTVTL